MNDVRLIHGDCLEILPTLEAGSIDAIVTSPPYNQLGNKMPSQGSGLLAGSRWISKVASKGYADDMGEEDYRAWLKLVSKELARVARPGASMFFNHKIRYRDGEMIHPIDYVREWDGWKLKQEIVWDRAGGFAFNCGLFAPSDERIYWLYREGGKPKLNDGSAAMLSVWRIASNKHIKGSVKGHPCPFPLEIPSRCIKAVTQPGDTVLDPFAGSGTTLKACLKTGRKGIGIELKAEYLAVANGRIDAARTPLFAEAAAASTTSREKQRSQPLDSGIFPGWDNI